MNDAEVSMFDWTPDDRKLQGMVVAVVGAAQSGKSFTVADLKRDRCCRIEPRRTLPGDPLIIQWNRFDTVDGVFRSSIDFLILCGKQDATTIDQIWSEYGHLFLDDCRVAFERKIHAATENWARAVLDVSGPCRKGLRSASVMRYTLRTSDFTKFCIAETDVY